MDGLPPRITKKKELTVLAVRGPLDIANAAQLRDRLLEAFARGKDVELSLAGMTGIDVAGLQLLCSSHRSSLSRGVGFTVTGLTQELAATAALAGMCRSKGCVGDTRGSCVWLSGLDEAAV